tara:strand:- start:240 stop:758 length:519 start_codon:yes stop_codon:yes gene_type:complete
VHYLEGFDAEVDVVFNNAIPFHLIDSYDKIVLSPGPGLPKDAGQMPKLIQEYFNKKPILGVCLGFQALVEFFGGEIYNQKEVKHGISEKCFFDIESRLFIETPKEYRIGLYHSWAAKKEGFPIDLSITAESENDIIMAFEHQNYPICGVQFHPESIMTENGRQIIKNFLLNF